MNIRKFSVVPLALVLLGSIGLNPAIAHRFNVALIIPLTAAEADRGRQYREGFMLATTERDGHPNEESDGHLGGLDVYVSVIDALGDVGGQVERMVAMGEINIVAAWGSQTTLATVGDRLDGSGIALLRPGQPPSDVVSLAAFNSAFENHYGVSPTPRAAQGYNAARRIDVAVRAQAGSADTKALRRSFDETASRFNWQNLR